MIKSFTACAFLILMQMGALGQDAPPAAPPGPEPGAEMINTDKLDTLTELNKRYEELRKILPKLNQDKEDLFDVSVFKKREDGQLDFDKDHTRMLSKLTGAIKLEQQLQVYRKQAEDLQKDLNSFPTITTAEKAAIVAQLRDVEAMIAQFQSLCNEVSTFQKDTNDTLIEEVHKIHLKNNFRLWVGAVWMFVFGLIFWGLVKLLRQGILVAKESSTLQLVAMIMIILVILLFGITDVMGENGVTGLLASIAGYILGKTTNSGDSKDSPNSSPATKFRLKVSQLDDEISKLTKDKTKSETTLSGLTDVEKKATEQRNLDMINRLLDEKQASRRELQAAIKLLETPEK